MSYELSGMGMQDVLGLGAGDGVSARADGLWKRTCMEVFVRRAPESGQACESDPYFELNAEPPQPLAHWQVYRFDSYRRASTPPEAEGVCLTSVSARWLGDAPESRAWKLELEAQLPPEAAEWPAWEIFPAAIVQGVDRPSGKFYEAFWASGHADGQPDFHRMVTSTGGAMVLADPALTTSVPSAAGQGP